MNTFYLQGHLTDMYRGNCEKGARAAIEFLLVLNKSTGFDISHLNSFITNGDTSCSQTLCTEKLSRYVNTVELDRHILFEEMSILIARLSTRSTLECNHLRVISEIIALIFMICKVSDVEFPKVTKEDI